MPGAILVLSGIDWRQELKWVESGERNRSQYGETVETAYIDESQIGGTGSGLSFMLTASVVLN